MSVYFITCRETGTVKIGSSLDPHARLKEIQTGSPVPLKLEAVLPGTWEDEFALHSRFADDRLHGEWFTLTPMIEEIIAANPAPPPPIKTPMPRQKPKPVPYRVREDRRRYQSAMRETRLLQALEDER